MNANSVIHSDSGTQSHIFYVHSQVGYLFMWSVMFGYLLSNGQMFNDL